MTTYPFVHTWWQSCSASKLSRVRQTVPNTRLCVDENAGSTPQGSVAQFVVRRLSVMETTAPSSVLSGMSRFTVASQVPFWMSFRLLHSKSA